jgi:hypothetical protein
MRRWILFLVLLFVPLSTPILRAASALPAAALAEPESKKWQYDSGWLRKDLAQKRVDRLHERGFQTRLIYEDGWWKVYYR